jgi:hypothetical protein
MLALTCSAWAFTPEGVIQGQVIDINGGLVPGIQVSWYDLDPFNKEKHVLEMRTGVIPSVETDTRGHFKIEHLVVGHHYAIVAKNESAGYPDMASPLYNPGGKKTQIAVAEPSEQSLDFTVRLGPKATRLEWEVKDASSAAPIRSIIFAIRRMDGGGEVSGQAPVAGSAPGKYGWLIPSNIPVTIEFSAPGYPTWYYPGTTNKANKTFFSTAPRTNKEVGCISSAVSSTERTNEVGVIRRNLHQRRLICRIDC